MVVAEHAAAGQGVLIQDAGRSVVAHLPHPPGKVERSLLGVLVVIAEPVAPVPAQVRGKVAGGAGIATGQQGEPTATAVGRYQAAMNLYLCSSAALLATSSDLQRRFAGAF